VKSDYFKITSTILSDKKIRAMAMICPWRGCLSVSVLRGGFSRDPLEDPGEIVGIGIAAGGAHLPDPEPGVLEISVL
jgi:hypothetical protein